jgi:NADPH:quinone reductase
VVGSGYSRRRPVRAVAGAPGVPRPDADRVYVSGMRAIIVTRHGGPEVLELQEVPDPEPGPGQLLVDVEAAGVNYRDIYEREGQGGYSAEPPLGAGAEGAGTVAAVGEGVHEFKPGDRVGWSAAPGSYAETVLVDEDKAVPVPEGVSTEVAAAALLQGMTAQYLATDTYAVRTGDDVLVHAAAGGVGLLLTQMVKLLGGRVVGTTSSEEKAALARGAGADHTIGYDGFAERTRELLGKRGVAVVYDGVGRATFDESLAALRPRGYMVLYGAASGPVPPVDPQRLNAGGSLFLTRPSLPHYTATRHELLSRAAQVFGWIADRRLDVRIGARYPLAQARRAQEDLAGRKTTGKLILDPQS